MIITISNFTKGKDLDLGFRFFNYFSNICNRFRGNSTGDSGSDGEMDTTQKGDIIDIETVKPPEIEGVFLVAIELMLMTGLKRYLYHDSYL